ncbi:hypothetical protein E6Q11_05020 [Candidatus Dojkabacteria bacterium]|uniref:DUF7483 domain-containing protein n=1 Tax=Candidatus Dojkabacteria bacterium TaxID=2099670 RepID=A0A5C7J4S7_9BACT|nr:MAG: hypothetical protein E6Q11_05020 [Candidatus Dojkabacteria bacterium]
MQLFASFYKKIDKLWIIPVIVLSSVFVNSPPAYAANFSMQTGYYIGSGATQAITNLGFQPDMVIIKSDTNAGQGVFKTSSMPANTTAYFSSTTIDTTTMIQLNTNGFTVSNSNTVNSANVRYTYTAFDGSDCTTNGTFCVGSYAGSGSTRVVTTGFQPTAIITVRNNNTVANFRTSNMANNYGQYFDTTAQNTAGALYTTISGTGYTVGATNNTSGGTYYYVAFKQVSGIMQTGSFTGNGTDNRNITGFGGGTTPNLVMVKNGTSSTAANRNPLMSQTNSYGDHSSFISGATANEVNMIQNLQSGGFQVGNGVRANENSATIYWMAWAGAPAMPAGSGIFDMTTGTYTGNNTNNRQIMGLGFQPDVVIIKQNNATQYSVMRTSMMQGNVSAYLSTNSANPTDAIINLTNDGFTLGTNTAVNANGGEYHWQAFGGAYNPVTRTGGADFMVGAYTGNGIDNRLIPTYTGFDLVTVKQHNGTSTSSYAYWRTTANSGDQASGFYNVAATANLIQDMNSDGFEVGTGNTNTAGRIFFWFAFKQSSNMSVGSYTGTGAAQTISSPDLQPDLLWVKRSTNQQGVMRPSTLAGNSTQQFSNLANLTNAITALTPTGFSLTGTTATTNANGGTYFYAAWRPPQLSADIVDSGGSPVGSPNVSMSSLNSSFSCNTSTGALGSSAQRLRVTNTTNSPNWTVDIAATNGTSTLWSDGAKTYDFNDNGGSPNGCADGLDSDNLAGQLTFLPASATIAPHGSGCSSLGVLRGSSASFREGVLDSLTLISSSGGDTGCYWDITGINISQTIPPATASGTYKLNLTMTIIAN